MGTWSLKVIVLGLLHIWMRFSMADVGVLEPLMKDRGPRLLSLSLSCPLSLLPAAVQLQGRKIRATALHLDVVLPSL